MTPGKPNPFIDPTELARYVDRSEQQFRDVLARERQESAATTAEAPQTAPPPKAAKAAPPAKIAPTAPAPKKPSS